MTPKTPLDTITDLLASGNRSELARLLNVERSTVSGWANPKRRARGMCGTIPEKYIPGILEIAGSRDVLPEIRNLLLARRSNGNG
ncbi:hypothetical protein [Rhizobium acaciae]|uniref:hypothetical protein n=1 Tax=Rhizobium acaciae TaxID=2989736 RepID=UPI003872B968